MAQEMPQQPPEGRLIEEAAKDTGRSIRQLAANAGLSDTRWRQIVRGWRPGPSGTYVEDRAPDSTLARMAFVVGLDPDALQNGGREKAAQLLRRMHADDPRVDLVPDVTAGLKATGQMRAYGRKSELPDEIDMIYNSASMTAQQKLEAIRMVLHLRAQAEREAAAGTSEVDDPQPQVKPSSR